MSAVAVEPRLPPALPGPYADPPAPDALEPHPATVSLVRGVVRDLLRDNPRFQALDVGDRVAFARNLVRVGSYLAECVRDDWYQSQQLGQRPLVLTRAQATAQSAADDFRPAAASQIGRVTTETLRAVAFPVFVADLIKGTFNAIQDSSQKQMESYMELLANVTKTVDEFEQDSLSDDDARAWLAGRYPRHITIDPNGTAVPQQHRPEGDQPNFLADLDLTESVDVSDASQIEQILVPAARRKLAQSRLKLLSTLVLMGINRIVVTGGKIRATMGFHINTRDTAHAESASQFQFGSSVSGSFGYGPWSASASVSVAYVSSTKADSNAEISTQTDLTGEVEIHFQSDYFPISRFSSAEDIDKIRANTPVPAANIPWGDSSPPGQVERLGPERTPSTTPFVAIPPSPTQATAPTPPDVAKKKEEEDKKKAADEAAKKAQDEAAKKKAQDEAAKKAQDDAAKKKAADEAAKKAADQGKTAPLPGQTTTAPPGQTTTAPPGGPAPSPTPTTAPTPTQGPNPPGSPT